MPRIPGMKGGDPGKAQGKFPTHIPCRICGKNKPTKDYSLNQLNKYAAQQKQNLRKPGSIESIGLTCKDHANEEPPRECTGPCGRVKRPSEFSNLQRNLDKPWCIECMEWRLVPDGTEAPTPLPYDDQPRTYILPSPKHDNETAQPRVATNHKENAAESSDDDDDSTDAVDEMLRSQGYTDGAKKRDARTHQPPSLAGLSRWGQPNPATVKSDTVSETTIRQQSPKVQNERELVKKAGADQDSTPSSNLEQDIWQEHAPPTFATANLPVRRRPVVGGLATSHATNDVDRIGPTVQPVQPILSGPLKERLPRTPERHETAAARDENMPNADQTGGNGDKRTPGNGDKKTAGSSAKKTTGRNDKNKSARRGDRRIDKTDPRKYYHPKDKET